MGVLTDYFRAPDADAARALVAGRVGSVLVAEPGYSEADGLEAKGIDPDVVLRSLIAMVGGVRTSAGVGRTRLVWPDESDAEALAEGPWVCELPATTRDALAAIVDDQVPTLADRWARTDELDGYATGEDLRPLVVDLAGLARRAAEAGDLLYSWVCL